MNQQLETVVRRVALACGGTFKRATKRGVFANVDAVGDIDVAKEVESSPAHTQDNGFEIVLARGETVDSLARKAAEVDLEMFGKTREVLRGRPGDLSVGLGQTPALGPMALTILGERLEQELHEGMWERLTSAAVRGLSTVEICMLNSLAGGTGKGTAIWMARKAVQMILNRAPHANANVTYFEVGGMSFNQLGPHIMRNAAIGVAEVMAEVMSPDHAEHEVRSAHFVELPAVGGQTELREQLASLLVQAWWSQGVQDQIAIRSINDARTGRFGRMLTLQPKWFEPISPETIRAGAVAVYLHELRELLASTGTVDMKIELTTEDILEREVITDEALVAQARAKAQDPELERKLEPVGPKYRVHVTANGGSVDSIVSRTPTTVPNYRLALIRSAVLVQALRESLGQYQLTLRKFELATNEARANTIKAYNACVNPGFGGFLKNEQKRAAEFYNQLRVYRTLARERRKAETQVAELENAVARADRLRNVRLIQPLRLLISAMEAQSGEELRGLVYRKLADTAIGGTTTVFGELIERSADPVELSNYLESSTLVWVSLEVVARMAGSPSDDPQTITEYILNGECWHESHPWGWLPRTDAHRTFVVVPPMAREDLERLQEEVPSGVHVVMSDTTAAGTAILVIHVFWVYSEDQVLTGLYKTEIDKVLGTDEANLVRVPQTKIWGEKEVA